MAKWQSVKTKMDPVIGQLLKQGDQVVWRR
jgi:hypothetical protein